MNYTEFKNKWLGKPINYDNAYGAQCMDVYRMYVKEVLLCPQSPPVQGAKDVWNTYLPEFFDRIPNTTTGVPAQGDIVIWGMSPYGHIAICDHATVSTLTCFEQNWVELDGSGVTELRLHGNYNNVLGWLKFKKSQGESMTDEQKRVLELLENYKITAGHGNLEGAINTLIGNVTELRNATESIENFKKDIETLKANINSLNSKYSELEAKFIENQKINEKQQKALVTANDKISELDKTIENITADKNSWQLRYNNKNDDFNNLSKLFEEYKKCNPQTETKFNLIQFIISLFKK